MSQQGPDPLEENDRTVTAPGVNPPVTAQSLLSNQVDPEDDGVPKHDRWNSSPHMSTDSASSTGKMNGFLNIRTDGCISATSTSTEQKPSWMTRQRDLMPRHHTSRAECNRRLWSQVDSPIQRDREGDKIIYLIR